MSGLHTQLITCVTFYPCILNPVGEGDSLKINLWHTQSQLHFKKTEPHSSSNPQQVIFLWLGYSCLSVIFRDWSWIIFQFVWIQNPFGMSALCFGFSLTQKLLLQTNEIHMCTCICSFFCHNIYIVTYKDAINRTSRCGVIMQQWRGLYARFYVRKH